jgi:hypothetical protein
MRKSQGKVLLTDMYEYIEVLNNWFLILLQLFSYVFSCVCIYF